MTNATRKLESIILAAGKGTRMNSDLPKVLHPVADRPMVQWVVDACEGAGAQRNIVVVGHHAEWVQKELADRRNCVFVEQKQQLGTGHAVMQAAPFYQGPEAGAIDVLVLCGDGPLIQTKTIIRLVEMHRRSGAAATLATAVLEDPSGYGRILRNQQRRFVRIVEDKDATPEEKAIKEVNPSYYCFKAVDLLDGLSRIDNKNSKGEYYLTDVLGIFVKDGRRVEVVEAVPPQDVLSINTPEQLAEIDAILRNRVGVEAR